MSALQSDSSSAAGAYIRDAPIDRGSATPEDAIHRRRKSAMTVLLGTFEGLIEPLIPSGNQKAIEDFKTVCRQKINGLAFEGIRAAKAQPGESVSRQTADLAETLAFTDDSEEN